MLEGLDDVDWRSLDGGDAHFLPDLLRQVASRDLAARNEAAARLFEHLRSDDDAPEAAVAAAPFLLEILAAPRTPDKRGLLLFLRDFFGGGFDDDSLDPYGRRAERESLDPTRRRLRHAADAGLAVFAKLLDARDPATRREAGRALTLCSRKRDAVSLMLRDRLPREKNAEVRASWALRLAVTRRRSDHAVVADLARSDGSPVVRFVAALVWASLTPRRAPPEARAIATETSRAALDGSSLWREDQRMLGPLLDGAARSGNDALPLWLALRRSRDEWWRREAVGRLAALDPLPPEAVEALRDALAADDAEARWDAVRRIRDAAERAFQSLRTPTDAAKLERRLDRAAPLLAALLMERLASEKDRATRELLFRAIFDFAAWSPAPNPALVAAARRNDEAFHAASAIGAYRDDDLERLVEIAACPLDLAAWVARRRLARRARESPGDFAPRLVAALRERLEENEYETRLVAPLLGELGAAAREALPALRASLQHRDPTTRASVADAIRRIDPAAAAENAVVDERAIRAALGDRAPAALVASVARLLDDSNLVGQVAALHEIAGLGPAAASARPFLVAALDKPWLRARVLGATSWFEPESIRPRIPECLAKFAAESGFGEAADFLAHLAPSLHGDAVAFLLSRLPTDDDDRAPPRTTIPYAPSCFRDPEPRVILPLVERVLVAAARRKETPNVPWDHPTIAFLARRGPEYAAAIPWLAPRLSSPRIAGWAIEALTRIGSWTAVWPLVEPCLESREPAVRECAERGLRRLADAATNDDAASLQAALESSSPLVRRAARAALERLKATG